MADKPFYFDPLYENLTKEWAGRAKDGDLRFNSFYDYYYSGEDVKVYIDGLFGQEDELDLASFTFAIRQEKQPLYGFWSYNYDAVMFGTRIVVGEFSVFTRYPRRMTDLLERAALARTTEKSARKPENSIVSRMTPQMGSNDDRINVMKYWGSSQLDRITYDPEGTSNRNIFSAHPPFNFVILHGVEEVAISPLSAPKSETYKIEDDLDRIIYSDVNQRSIRLDNGSSPTKTVIQQVNLTSMSTGYTPGGSALVEIYQFIARDFYFTEADLSFVKSLPTYIVSENDTNTGPPANGSTETGFGGGAPGSQNGPAANIFDPLNGIYLNYPVLTNKTTINIGARGDLVKYLQAVLNNNAGISTDIDGVFGSGTDASVRAFQLANGLVVDGYVGPLTWAAIDSLAV